MIINRVYFYKMYIMLLLYTFYIMNKSNNQTNLIRYLNHHKIMNHIDDSSWKKYIKSKLLTILMNYLINK